MAAASHVPEAVQQEDTFIAHSPSSSTTDELLRNSSGSPYALLEVGCFGGAEEGGEGSGAQLSDVQAEQQQQASRQGKAGSPPGTPPTVTGEVADESYPGSAVVEDDTVVQTGEGLEGGSACCAFS